MLGVHSRFKPARYSEANLGTSDPSAMLWPRLQSDPLLKVDIPIGWVDEVDVEPDDTGFSDASGPEIPVLKLVMTYPITVDFSCVGKFRGGSLVPRQY